VSYALGDDGVVKISVTMDRAKTVNLKRDSRASMTVIGENWFEYVVVEGAARFVENDPAALRDVYRRIAGRDHPDWAEYDAAMVRDRRLVLAIDIERMYPLE
jgi:PPOX class probable F420-dependent enzyme